MRWNFASARSAEMTEGDIYEAVDTYSRQNKLAYVHLRNVRDKVPFYKETFIDDGDSGRAARAADFEKE